MVEHIVLFKWTEEATPEAISTVLQELRKLPESIPGIITLTCGENFSERAKGYTHGLYVRFESRADLDVYGPHPAHQHVVQTHINPIRADVLAFDYEV